MASEKDPKHFSYRTHFKLYLFSILYNFQRSLINYQASIILLILYLCIRMAVNGEFERAILG